MLQGCGAVFQFAWSLLQYVYPQQRLATATGAMLEIYAQDFFGSELPRDTGETDDAYRARIEAALVPLRFTRPAIEAAIADSWDDSWALVEPRNANDTKGIATAASPAIGGGFGYGTNLEAGYTAEIGDPTLRYGSLLAPFRVHPSERGADKCPAGHGLRRNRKDKSRRRCFLDIRRNEWPPRRGFRARYFVRS